MPCQDVKYDTRRVDIVGQSLRTCRFNGVQPVGQDGPKDIDHLTVTAGLAFELSPHASYGNGQLPVLERRAVAQSAWFAGEHWQVMQGIIDRFASPEGALVLTNDLPILPTFQPIRIGADLHGTTNCAGIDGVTVVVKTHEAGLGNRGRNRVESIKGADIWDQAGALFLEHLPDGLVAHLRVFVCLGIGDAAVFKPCIELGVRFELRAGHKEPSPDHTNLVLDLALLPA